MVPTLYAVLKSILHAIQSNHKYHAETYVLLTYGRVFVIGCNIYSNHKYRAKTYVLLTYGRVFVISCNIHSNHEYRAETYVLELYGAHAICSFEKYPSCNTI